MVLRLAAAAGWLFLMPALGLSSWNGLAKVGPVPHRCCRRKKLGHARLLDGFGGSGFALQGGGRRPSSRPGRSRPAAADFSPRLSQPVPASGALAGGPVSASARGGLPASPLAQAKQALEVQLRREAQPRIQWQGQGLG